MKKQITFMLLSLSVVTSISFLAYEVLSASGNPYDLINIVSATLLLVFAVMFMVSNLFIMQPKEQIYVIITSLFLTCFVGFNLLVSADIITVTPLPTLEDFTNVTVNEVLEWGTSNEVEIIQEYEYSETIDEYHIISQSVAFGTLMDDVTTITFIISSGPNPDKSIVVSNMLGWNIDDVTTYISNNNLSNVNISYEFSDLTKDSVISQDADGNLRRNDEINIIFSLGAEGTLAPVEMEDLSNQTIFDASLWLMKHGIKYNLSYEFSDIIERKTVISQDFEAGVSIDPNTEEVNLIVSMGNKIIVPDLLNMTVTEITAWIIDNNLKIEFTDDYDDEIEIGTVISTNYDQGYEIEEETLVEILTSKGPLVMGEFNSLAAFREWATKYNISYEENYQFSDSVSSGSVISYSVEEGATITNGEKITVAVSQGKAVTVPYFLYKSKSEITSTCNSIGLNCSFYYGSYSSTTKDYAVYQNKSSGSTVIEGTYVSIALSKGPASSFTLRIFESDLSIGSASGTISSLKSKFASEYPDVTFTYITKASNTYTLPGYIHESSPTKSGATITQGNTYQIWITE